MRKLDDKNQTSKEKSNFFQWKKLLLFVAGLMFIMCSCTSLKTTDKPVTKFTHFAGWGSLNSKQFRVASEIGLTDIITWSNNPKVLKRMIGEGEKYNIGVYAGVVPFGGAWKRKYPKLAPVYQQQTPLEDFILSELKDKKYQLTSAYQHGGEPTMSKEVLRNKILCLHHPSTKDALKAVIEKLVKIPGLKGIAFDGVGYQNYNCCYCPSSMTAFKEYYKTRKNIPVQKAFQQFSLKTLVDFNNELSDYARKLNPKILVTTHIWPVYEPEPLYGNRLNTDYCGQTAAWFFPWNLNKIEKYSGIISRDETKYFPNAKGVAMVGVYYDSAPTFPEKSPLRIEQELKAILKGGCRNLQVCSINHVLKRPEIAAVFKKYCAKNKK